MPTRLGMILLLAALVTATAISPAAGDECVLTPTGVECRFEGTTTTVIAGEGEEPGDLPPLRYLRVPDGECWYWSRWPPGIDGGNSANDTVIVTTIWRLPECTGPDPEPVRYTTSQVVARAWEIFRRFPLAGPRLALQPAEAGVTGIPSFASAPPPDSLAHAEQLPDGTPLEVRAVVGRIIVAWGDETPPLVTEPAAFRPWPDGSVSHTFLLKTCEPEYRTDHPSGGNCHPKLDAYPVAATFVWTAQYRHLEGWRELGTLWRTTTIRYDVDEAVGVLR